MKRIFEYRKEWFEFTLGWNNWFSCCINQGWQDYDDRFSFGLSTPIGSLYFCLPYLRSKRPSWWDRISYGVTYIDKMLSFQWGKHRKSFEMPWAMAWQRSSYLLADGKWIHELPKKQIPGRWDEDFKLKLWVEHHPYRYTLRNGTVQERIATVTVEEREWRPRWLQWTKRFAKVRRSIAVEFNDEVGERTGSWKGGTMGCGYDLKPNESFEECLRRMESERKFT